MFVGVAIVKRSLGRHLTRVCIATRGEIAVLAGHRGAGAITELQFDGIPLDTVVTNKWDLVCGSEQDSISSIDQTQGAW